MGDIAPDAEVREAAASGLLELAGWFFQAMTDPALHAAMGEFVDRQESYAGEQKVLLERILSMFEGYGLGKDQATRDTMQELNLQTEQLTQTIKYYLANGDPEAKIPELYTALIKTQTAWANLRGWESYGAYTLSMSMAKTPEAARAFVQDLSTRLDAPFQTRLSALTAIKAAETQDPAATIYRDDIINYLDRWIEQEYQIADFTDRYFHEDLFALDDVLAALFGIAETTFGIDFVETDPPGAPWHEDVRYFQATDTATGEALGSFYMDLYQRAGKLSNQRIEKVVGAYTREDGKRLKPVNVYIADFPRPPAGSPTLLSIYEAGAIFHEFGHLLQHFCSGSRYYYSFPVIMADYQELPSMFLALWVSDPAVMISLFGQNPGWSAQELERWQKALQAYFLPIGKWWISISMLSLQLYADYGVSDVMDPVALSNTALEDYFVPNQSAASSEIIGLFQQLSYPGSYYGYLWSDVIAHDLVSRFRATGDGLLNPVLGQALRQKIYAVGHAYEPEENIRSFLGREWRYEPYYESLGAQ